MTDRVLPTRPLTARQRDVVKLIVRGLSYREIGESLSISEGRVENIVRDVANLIPNPTHRPAKQLVFGWALTFALTRPPSTDAVEETP